MKDVLSGLPSRLDEEYPATSKSTLSNVRLWLSGELPLVPTDSLHEFLRNSDLDLIHESFWRSIPFGTGGVRGTVGFGPNRINRTVVALTIQAHCDYLNHYLALQPSTRSERTVVIANDVRRFLDAGKVLKFLSRNPLHADDLEYGVSSRSLAYLAAEVYAGNGFTAYIMNPTDDDALLTTPELSYLIRWMKASGGVNLSASHNPPDDNGIKIYDENGGQYLPPRDEELTKMTGIVRSVKRAQYQEALGASLIRDIPNDGLVSYTQLYLKRAERRGLRSTQNTRVLFTPLSGCGERTVGKALSALNYSVYVPDGERPDGTFAKIPLLAPNPEVEQATRNSKLEADLVHARLVLATDPDADRLGAEVFHRGSWHHLSGNQIATILVYYLVLDEDGPKLTGAVYQTIVTTLAVSKIARQAGCSPVVDDLLVGFKYIGEAVRDLANELGPDADDTTLLTFAAEESHGFLDNPHLRDKDAMAGALYLARLHEALSEKSLTLIDYLDAIFDQVGDFGDRGRSITVMGSAGVRAIKDVMEELRRQPPRAIGNLQVVKAIDYWSEEQFGAIKSETDREARNVLVFEFQGGRTTLRPSGTEPKLKFYVQTTEKHSTGSAQEYADSLSDVIYTDVLRVMGHDLDIALAGLPDIVPLDAKLVFQNVVLPEFLLLVRDHGMRDEVVARWLSDQVSKLIPGEAAWEIGYPALRAAVEVWPADDARRAHVILSMGEVQ